jgi:hypothetical protein
VRATLRLVAGLSERDHEATVISLAPAHDPGGIGVEARPARDDGERSARAAGGYLQNAYIGARRTTPSNTLFSPRVAGYSVTDSRLLDVQAEERRVFCGIPLQRLFKASLPLIERGPFSPLFPFSRFGYHGLRTASRQVPRLDIMVSNRQ